MTSQQAAESGQLVTHTLRSEGHSASEDGTGRGVPLVFDERNVTSRENRSNPQPGGPCHTLHGKPPTVAYQQHGSDVGMMGTLRATDSVQGGVPFIFQTRISRNGRGQPSELAPTLTSCAAGTHADSKPHVAMRSAVRRLTPRECERLQGFPDDWTLVDGMSDSARYRMLGNAVPPPMAKWIGRRIMEQS